MATPFIGLNVRVKLKNPPATLHGHVSGVQGQQLFLSDVFFLWTGKRLPQYTIHGAEIQDIEVISPAPGAAVSQPTTLPLQKPVASQAPAASRYATSTSSASSQVLLRPAQLPPSSSTTSAHIVPRATTPSFVDPAILSFERSPVNGAVRPTLYNGMPSASPDVNGSAITQAALRGGQEDVREDTQVTSPLDAPFLAGPTAMAEGFSASLSEPSTGLQINGTVAGTQQMGEETHILEAHRVADGTEQGPLAAEGQAGKASGRRRKRSKKGAAEAVQEPDTSPEITHKHQFEDDPKLNGWRSTPMLQPQNTTPKAQKSGRTPGLIDGKVARDALKPSSRIPNRRQRQMDKEASKSGWATEDVSDVRDLGDFDFMGSLATFDKKAVWDELRAGDTTADEDRLVSFNRVKPAGMQGVEKLRPTEMVLSSRRAASPDDDDDMTDTDVASDAWTAAVPTRQSVRNHSRTSLVRQSQSSRKQSVRTDTGSTAAPAVATRSLSRHQPADSSTLRSPQAPSFTSPPSSAFSASAMQPANPKKPHLRYTTTNRICRTATPSTLQSIETLAATGFALSQDVLAENAGRGIAEVILRTIDPTGARLAHTNHNAYPVVVMLIGENNTGARALAAARHLLDRNVRVIAALTSPVDLEQGSLSLQIQRFRGKVVRSWEDTLQHLRTLDAPPELIVDALVGACDALDELDDAAWEVVQEMVAWSNAARAAVLSIDIPTGVDAGTGERLLVPEGDGFQHVSTRVVVACGVPTLGLVKALEARRGDWRIFVVDMGLNPAARPFMKMRVKEEDGDAGAAGGRSFVSFGSEWVVGVRFCAGVQL